MIILITAALVIFSYLYGCFSSARIIAKSFRSLNIYKVGTGLADTENIYFNVSKTLGVLVGTVDTVKSYGFLLLMKYFLIFLDKIWGSDLCCFYSSNMLMLYGLAVLVGHCLPLTNHLRGGRGIFTYMGIIGFFVFYPMFITAMFAFVLIFGYRQIRFAQYSIVLLPVFLTILFGTVNVLQPLLLGVVPSTGFIGRLVGIMIVMGILNFLVSKKLGEF